MLGFVLAFIIFKGSLGGGEFTWPAMAALCAIGLDMFSSSTMTTVFVSVLGLVCAQTKLGKVPAVEELSSVYLYAVVSLLASKASLVDLISAPMWLDCGT